MQNPSFNAQPQAPACSDPATTSCRRLRLGVQRRIREPDALQILAYTSSPPYVSSPLRKLVTLLLFTVLAIKIAATLARGPVPIEMDAFQYWRLSSTVMSGDLLMLSEPIAYRTPVYPWFLAAVRLLSSDPLFTIVILQGVMYLAGIVIAGQIAARITQQPSAMAWTFVAALPAVSAITFAAATLTETIFVFLLMLHLLAVVQYAKRDTVGRLLWLAITFALTLLTRPIVILLWIPHVIFLLFIHVRRRRRLGKSSTQRVKLHHRFGHGLIAIGVIALMIAPWLARNHYLFDKVFVTEFVGRNVWIVTFQDGSGAGLAFPDTEASQKLQWRLSNVGATDNWRHTWTRLQRPGRFRAQQRASRPVDAASRDRRHRRQSGTVRLESLSPLREFLACAATDLPEQGRGEGNYRGQRPWQVDVPAIDWAIDHRLSQSVLANTILTGLIALATLLLICRWLTRPYGIWIALMLGYFSVVTGLVEIPDYRYRIVVEPLCMVVMGAAAATLIAGLRDRKMRLTV